MLNLTPNHLKQIVTSTPFEKFIIFIILVAGVLVGLETYPEISTEYHNVFIFFDILIIGIFIIEALLKIAAEIPKPLNYFKNSWNVFDFIIVVGCLLSFIFPFEEGTLLPVLRLLRVLRLFRLITTIPKLRLIVGAMLKSIPSMMYVFILLALIFYTYAVMGTFLFGENDPIHFKNLQTSLLTLFRIITFDDWTEVMYINKYGCDQYGYEEARLECTHPKAAPFLAPLFFISFAIIAGLVFLNFIIGVIINSMEEMKSEMIMVSSDEDNLTDKKKREIILVRLDKLEKKMDLIIKNIKNQE